LEHLFRVYYEEENPRESLPDQSLEVDDAKKQLDKVGREYFEGINSSTPESLITVKNRLEPLQRFIPQAKTVVSVGVGLGEEVHALEELFGQQGVK
jgi:hypothetical protein